MEETAYRTTGETRTERGTSQIDVVAAPGGLIHPVPLVVLSSYREPTGAWHETEQEERNVNVTENGSIK